jgi:hypothetical protein
MMLETKVKAGTLTGALTGVVIWALVAFIPAFHDGVPEAVVALIPFVLAWAGHTAAGYLAPHTHRPDLEPQQAAPEPQQQQQGGQ